MINDLRFKVDEIFSNLVDSDEKTIILLDHNKRYVYKGLSKKVLVYFTDKFNFINYAILDKHTSKTNVTIWCHLRVRRNTVEDAVKAIYELYK